MKRVLGCAVLLAVLAAPARAAARDSSAENPPLRMYRAAEASLRIGEYADTRRRLRTLIERYPGTEWAERARRLLNAVPGGDDPGSAADADAPFVPAMPSTSPDEALARLRGAADGGADDQALGEAYDFLARYPDSPLRPELELAAGALHLRRGEARTALKFLLPLARASGRLRTRALHLAGGALIALGREGDVLRLVPAADPASPSTDRWLALAQVWRAAALERSGRKDDAAELYRAVAASGQESPVRAYALAAIAADWDRQGKPDRARDALVRAGTEAARWRLDGLRDALALAGANALARARRHDEAAKAYLDFARRYPDSPLVAQAYYERGLALKRLDRKEDAVKSFEALLDRAPDSAYAADAHLQLGQLDTELGRTGEALSHYRKMGRASEAKDADREALLLMAQVHYNAKRWGDAIPLYRRWLNGAPPADPKTKDVQGLLLVALWSGDKENAELAELAAKIPDHPLVAQIRWSLATAAYKRGDWASASELFKRQIESDPSSPRTAEARFYRAEALRQLGERADAADAYKRYLAAHPQDKHAREATMRLGALLYESGDAAGAAAAYGRVTGDDAEAADAAYNRALALSKAGKDPAGAWESFAGKFPKHAKASWAWWTSARMREERHEDAEAARDYERASGPDEKTKALYALGRLQERLKHAPAAKAAYQRLLDAEPKDDPPRLAGLLRLALMLELEDKPRSAAPLYTEVMKRSSRGTSTFETARKRLEALTQDKSLVK
ncbi:MAG: tetratricopeptide repeat protein [Elusimicrobia bacterium]|nr:tetratricopeptide repeat protein [Elusimicrobiota bacterium]